MADKDSGRYRYESYPSLATKQHNNGPSQLVKNEPPSTLKTACSNGNIDQSKSEKSKRCCSCMGPKATSFWVGLLTNLGICTLLFGYTLLGSFIFLAIEGGASTMQQRTLASTNRQLLRPPPQSRLDNVSLSQATVNEATEARQRTVENIWDITVSLNILYRENWTRLAALEIARFQDQLIKRITDEMTAQLEGNNVPLTGAVMYPQSNVPEFDWTFARAFLYSLTVLTTIAYMRSSGPD
ncbi:hypothetical protein HA402_013105 [Bradysia odoriphaga]|nr:hypothetical protein HA402_013105 [Bradysia odoriphaga]